MYIITTSLLALGAISSVSAHGLMTSPAPRAVGAATSAACGSQVAAIIKGDPTSHIEGLPEAAATDSGFDASKCNLFLCKGLQFADNTANVVALTGGQSLELKFSIPIPHEGPCNVSVVDTKTNTVIGSPLIEFTSYADESLPVLPKNNTDMTVTVPTTLGNKCATAGDCVIQWFWFGTAADQTYESCLDFTLADSSSGSSTGNPSNSGNSGSVASASVTSTSAVPSAQQSSAAAVVLQPSNGEQSKSPDKATVSPPPASSSLPPPASEIACVATTSSLSTIAAAAPALAAPPPSVTTTILAPKYSNSTLLTETSPSPSAFASKTRNGGSGDAAGTGGATAAVSGGAGGTQTSGTAGTSPIASANSGLRLGEGRDSAMMGWFAAGALAGMGILA